MGLLAESDFIELEAVTRHVQLCNARSAVAQAYVDLACVRESTAEALSFCVPADCLDHITQAHDLVLANLARLRDALGRVTGRGPEAPVLRFPRRDLLPDGAA